MTARTRSTQKPAPPADAVAKDAHWTSTRERLLNRGRPVLKLTICDDDELKRAVRAATGVLANAKAHAEEHPGKEADKLLADAQAAYDKAKAELDESSIVLSFQALERRAYRSMISDHRPTEAQVEEGYEFNLDAMAPVLIAASSLDGITVEDAKRFLEEWSDAEGQALLNTAFGVQREDRMDLGKG
ncbi:hypothetical protein ACFQ6Q_00410 [Streptomyces sp. NPDC056437]|uniref:hypothetical protein n=1 Tax=Streptomyces sp. NPDC056437 TaxID=3345816 RepID=UPI003699264B